MPTAIKYKAAGRYVEVNGHKIHVFCTGQGKNTFVFLSGAGTSYPTLDFKPLWSLLANEHRLVVVERAGYGWSDITSTSNDLDITLDETRQALKLSNIKDPYILVPHSISGLEAIYWAQKHPDEISAIIGLDPAIPEVYDTLKIPPTIILNILGILTKIGIHKPFAKIVCKKSPTVQSGYLSEDEIETYVEMFRKRTLTTNMVSEAKNVRKNASKVKLAPIPCDTPIYVFISSRNEKVLVGWSKLLSDYVSTFKSGKCLVLDCGHYVHTYESEKISKEITDFISCVV